MAKSVALLQVIIWLKCITTSNSACIKLYVSFRWWSSIPLGAGGALFSFGGASNKVTTNTAWVFYYWESIQVAICTAAINGNHIVENQHAYISRKN